MHLVSLTGDRNPILREYLFKKKMTGRHTATAGDCKKILSDYFDFLALQFQLPSGIMVSEREIEGTTSRMIHQYEHFLRQDMNNSEATAYSKLACIRLFYEDYGKLMPDQVKLPALFLDYPLPREKRLFGRIHSPAYYLKFFRKIDGAYQIRDRLMLAILTTMGLTGREICALNVEDVFLKNGDCRLRITGRAMVSDAGKRDTDRLPEPQHPILPVNRPTAELLRSWLSLRPETEKDAGGQPLFLTKYKRRFKEKGIIFIFKNYAIKQYLNPADTHPDLLRKFAIQSWRDQDGGESGLHEYFGCRIFNQTEKESDPGKFTDSEWIRMLENEIAKDKK